MPRPADDECAAVAVPRRSARLRLQAVVTARDASARKGRENDKHNHPVASTSHPPMGSILAVPNTDNAAPESSRKRRCTSTEDRLPAKRQRSERLGKDPHSASSPPLPAGPVPPNCLPPNTRVTFRDGNTTFVRQVFLPSQAGAPPLPRPNLTLRIRWGGRLALHREAYLRSRDDDATLVGPSSSQLPLSWFLPSPSPLSLPSPALPLPSFFLLPGPTLVRDEVFIEQKLDPSLRSACDRPRQRGAFS